jgi:hypothetical protein
VKRRGPRRTSLQLQPHDLDLLGADAPHAFLGRLSADALARELEAAGVTGALARRGHPRLDIGTAELEGEHRLRVVDADSGALLIDLRLAEATATGLPDLLRERGVDSLPAIVILWVTMQDPQAAFTPDRSPLPGQDHPGLGVSRQVYELVRGWAARWGKDAVLNVPEYFHNAVFYAVPFRFLDPTDQGRFLALQRDLAGLSVAEASRAIEGGRVCEEPGGRPFAWAPGDMAAPIAPALEAYLRSEEYAAATLAARDSVRFSVAAG